MAENYSLNSSFGLNVSSQGAKKQQTQKTNVEIVKSIDNFLDSATGYVSKYENVFNGDIGYIINIKGNEITIDFDSNIVKYNTKDLNTIKHAYAISVHKAQGSEFKIVFMPVTMSYKAMLYKKLIYTAITRAKEQLFIIGDLKYLSYASSNNKENLRRTSIKEFLNEGIK